jgi:hypothetical protein
MAKMSVCSSLGGPIGHRSETVMPLYEVGTVG